MIGRLSLTPNFSWVSVVAERQNRFNGLDASKIPLKRLNYFVARGTRLKPGVNEKAIKFDQRLSE